MLNDLIILDEVQENYLQDVLEFIKEWENDADYIEVKTSGSTGEPKNIQLTKEKVRLSAQATGAFFAFEKGKTILLNLSPSYIAGKLQIVRAIEHEMKLVIAPLGSNPLIYLEQPVYFAAFVPSQIQTIIEEEETIEKLQLIEHIIIGGAPLPPPVENELSFLHKHTYVSFGMTETITHFALRRIGTPIYNCLPNYQISVDQRSCLVIQPNEIVEDLLITNDVIDVIDEKSFKWKGRVDFVINSGGVKIHPEKVEKMIAHLIPHNNFYITSKQDDKLGEIAILLIEGEFEVADLLEQTKSYLPRYHSPKEVYLKGAFNYTESGKIIREKF